MTGRNYRKNKKLYDKLEELGPVTPQQVAVIIGLVTRVLRVRAVVLDVEQNVEIILEGKLLKNKNLQKLMNEMNEEKVEEWIEMLQKFHPKQ
ncbi:hypothetical protein [Evansella cellulosilytica]|uniref:Uncharacterized protein n=1 Tax=Evansella cellulosilytica (strain ATCC 21833 / DSM 2522 / FERM P-1141 / JCM 9156 / N-4) TaxID=649639 RepID=E6TYP9_EVAC2|nr:hypothetical protein [Evansella cellulosilytica]ADU30099.1 hypothetical protein Bcell_1837 [Evansella cellulosilytica DSM 2522]